MPITCAPGAGTLGYSTVFLSSCEPPFGICAAGTRLDFHRPAGVPAVSAPVSVPARVSLAVSPRVRATKLVIYVVSVSFKSHAYLLKIFVELEGVYA